VRAALIVLLVLAVPAANAAPAQSPEPALVVRSFVAYVRGSAGPATFTWRSPEWVAYRPAPGVEGQPFVQAGGLTAFGLFPPPERGRGDVVRRSFAARPDAYSFAYARYGEPVDVVLGRARSGVLKLQATRQGGRPAWRARVALPPNTCAALPRGTATAWLDRATLLPLRLDWVRGTRIRDSVTLRYRSLNRPLPPSAFRLPALGPNPVRRDQGFRRTSARAADARVSYAAQLPAAVPAGFRLTTTGWAPRSGITGPEGSNPRHRELFAAVYRRGWERIDVTQRRGAAFPNDPFGFECGVLRTQRVMIDGVQATYGEGPEIVPHLYWRAGGIVHTVSGPFPRATLVAIAESLGPVS
jgi:hypothetical protein